VILVPLDAEDDGEAKEIEVSIPPGIRPGQTFEYYHDHIPNEGGNGKTSVGQPAATAAAEPASGEEAQTDLHLWLASTHLESYAAALIEHGFDDLQILMRLDGPERAALAEDIGMSSDEAARLASGIADKESKGVAE